MNLSQFFAAPWHETYLLRILEAPVQSPGFHIRQKELKAIFSIANLKRVWRDKVRISLRSSYIQDPIEHVDFHVALSAHCLRVQSAVCDGIYRPSSTTRILVEKSKGLCRQVVVPAIDDAIVLQVLSDALFAIVKDKAPTKKSFYAPEDHRFSQIHRAAKGAPRYGSLRAWLDFQEAILKFSKTREYVVVTDIANYYDFISYTHLRNIISALGASSEPILDMLIFSLSGLLWQPDYMPRVELGLPQMNLDAPRMLAHCFLYELDRFIDGRNLDFARYMDDIDVGADTMIEAKSILRDIDLLLQTRQVRLNSGKTRILTKVEAFRHFKARENDKLDILALAIQRKRAKSAPPTRERVYLRALYQELRRAKSFNDGNGDKVLKRILSFSGRIGVQLPHADLKRYLFDWPSIRESIFSYIAERGLNRARFELLSEFMRTSGAVDSSSYLEAAYAMTDGAVRHDFGVAAEIDLVVADLKKRGNFGFYASVWLLSKYAPPDPLLKFVRDHFDQWRADTTLGRLIGGLYPIFHAAKYERDLARLIDGAQNVGASDVYAFHARLLQDARAVGSIHPLLRSTNPSKPLRITHAKALLLLSALQNDSLSANQKIGYLKVHNKAWSDVFYRRRVRSLRMDRSLLRHVN